MPAVARVRPALHHLQTLDPREVYRGQVFHDGMLWQGHSVGGVSAYRVDAHAADGSLMASAQVPHTVEFLHAFGPRAVLAVGKHLHHRRGWRTYHSIVRCVTTAGRARRLRVTTRGMPWHLQVEQFGGGPRAMFFNEPGSSTVIRWGGWRARQLRPDLRFPGTMILRGRHLFVLERNHYRPGQETIARIDLVSQQVERARGTLPCGIAALVDVPGSPWIAAAEAWADRVLLIDAATSRIAAVLRMPGRPVELAACGRRLAVLSAAAQTLWFFDLATAGQPPVAEWDLAALGPQLEHPRGLDVDPVTKIVFIRTGCHPLLERSVAGVALAVDPAR